MDGQSDETVCDFIKSKIEFTIELNSSEQNYDVYWDYQCYFSLENIEKEGGFGVPNHIIGTNIMCHPNMMLSKESFELLKEDDTIKCPICCKEIKPDSFVFLNSKEIEYNKLNTISEP